MRRHDLSTTDRLLLRPPEAAATLGVSLRTLMSMVAAGTVPVVRLHNRCLRFSTESLRRWIAERTTGNSRDGSPSSLIAAGNSLHGT